MRSREADLLSVIENMDVLIGNWHVFEIQKDVAGENRNSNTRDGSSNENAIRTYNRTSRHERPVVSELLENNFETMANEMSVWISQELDGLLFVRENTSPKSYR